MSSLNLADAAVLESLFVQNAGLYGVTALIWYEYIITLQDEVSLFWFHKWSSSTWIFMASRYCLLAMTITEILPIDRAACYNTGLQVTIAMLQNNATPLIAAVFSSLRVFALLDRNYLIAGGVFLIGLIPVGTTTYSMFITFNVYVNNGLINSLCERIARPGTSLVNINLIIVNTSARVLSDAAVLLVTWRKTYSSVKQANSLHVDVGLTTVIFRDGSIYFIALLVINLAALVMLFTPVPLNPLSPLPSTVPLILIWRFIINLHQVDLPDVNNTTADNQDTTLNFRIPTVHDVLGNMGESLAFGDDRDPNDSEETEVVPDQHDADIEETDKEGSV